MTKIDLNSDLGESFARYSLGRDSEIIPLVSSVNPPPIKAVARLCGSFILPISFKMAKRIRKRQSSRVIGTFGTMAKP